MFRISIFGCALIMLASLFVVAPAGAVGVDLMAGSSFTSGQRWTPTVFADVSFNNKVEGLHVEPMASVGWVRHRRTSSLNLNHNVYVFGGGARLANIFGGGFASFQLAGTSGRTDALSSHGQFISSVGWRTHNVVFKVRHISNGDFFGGRNLGETMFLVGTYF